jgi:hypothetical protein
VLVVFEEDVRDSEAYAGKRKGQGQTRHGLEFCDAWGSEGRGC